MKNKIVKIKVKNPDQSCEWLLINPTPDKLLMLKDKIRFRFIDNNEFQKTKNIDEEISKNFQSIKIVNSSIII